MLIAVTAVVNTAVVIPFTFVDDFGALVTGKVNADFTKAAYLASDPTTTATPTVGAISGQSGDYGVTVTPTATGLWRVNVSHLHTDGETYRFGWTVQVVTAAQFDPVTGLAGGVTVTVATPIDAATDRLTLVRGDAYLNTDSSAVSFTVTSPSLVGATAAFSLETFAGVTALSKAMTISGTTVRADLTAVETAALTKGTPVYRYEAIATLSGGSTRTLAQGDVWVTD